MDKRGTLTKILAVAGTVLVWIPVLAPVFFSIIALTSGRGFRFDYLMPAELFPLAFVGSLLLVWASLRARSRRKLILWSLAAGLASLVLGQVIASVTGLASGAIEPNGWQWALVLSMLAAYCLALVSVGVGGILLLVDLFKKEKC